MCLEMTHTNSMWDNRYKVKAAQFPYLLDPAQCPSISEDMWMLTLLQSLKPFSETTHLIVIVLWNNITINTKRLNQHRLSQKAIFRKTLTHDKHVHRTRRTQFVTSTWQWKNSLFGKVDHCWEYVQSKQPILLAVLWAYKVILNS